MPRFGQLKVELRRIGHPLHQADHTADLGIAAIAISLDLPLIAHDGVFIDCPELDLRTEL